MSGCSNMNVLLQKDRLHFDPFWVPSSSVSLRGTNSMVDFDNVGRRDASEPQFFRSHISDENGDGDFDLSVTSSGKKRRLTAAQVQFLEKNFELENKLEPEKKVQLAKELGLQPRQVAIWFQNRRARSKNKQLERDYDSLKASYDRMKLDYEKLVKENEFLKSEAVSLREKLLIRNGNMEGEPHDTIISSNAEHQHEVPNLVPEYVSNAPTIVTKQDDSSSADFDPDSPHSFREPTDSSRLLEPEPSDFSQDEDDSLSRKFLPISMCFPKLYEDSPAANSCTFEFPGEYQHLWSWTF